MTERIIQGDRLRAGRAQSHGDGLSQQGAAECRRNNRVASERCPRRRCQVRVIKIDARSHLTVMPSDSVVDVVLSARSRAAITLGITDDGEQIVSAIDGADAAAHLSSVMSRLR